jgi:hypothetical protein
MELIHQHAGTYKPSAPASRVPRTAIAAALLAVAALTLFALATAFGPSSAPAAGLSAQQIVIRAEVADRQAAQSTSTGLSAQQLVIRAEVADREAASGRPAGLSPQQIVIRGEISDRLAAPAK